MQCGDLCPRCLPGRPSELRVTARLAATIGSHSRDVTGVAFSGGLLATSSGDKTVRLWAVDSWLEANCSPLRGHGYSVNYVAFSPFGTILVSCSTDGKAVFWDPKNGQQLSFFTHPSKCSIRAGAFSLNSQLFASGGEDGSVCLWDVLSRTLLRSLSGHCGSVLGLAFSPDSRLLVSGSASGDLRVWDGRFGRAKALQLVLDAHDLGVAGVDVAPCPDTCGDSKHRATQSYTMATGGSDNLVKIWRLTSAAPEDAAIQPAAQMCMQHGKSLGRQGTLTLLFALKGHSRAVMAVRFSPNGKLLISCSGDHTVRIWKPETAASLHVVEAHTRYVTSCCFSSDGRRLASGSNDRLVRVWDLAIEEDEKKKEEEEEELRCQQESTELERDDDQDCDDTQSYCCCGSGSGSSDFEDNAESDYTSCCATAHEPAPVVPSPSCSTVLAWTSDHVARLLGRLGLGEHSCTFCQHAIDGRALVALTDSRLRNELGVQIPSHRKKLLDAIVAIASCRPVVECHPGVPDEYLCPVTREIMQDPVIAADGYTYERSAIESWFQRSGGRTVSPMTYEPVGAQLIPNRSLKMLIQRYLADQL